MTIDLAAVDRGIYEALRVATVKKGHLPDIVDYDTVEAYIAQKDIMRTDLTLIDVFGIGNSESRQEKTDSKIVIDRMGILDAGASLNGGIGYELDRNDNYTKLNRSKLLYNVDYEVRLITTSARMDRIMHSIILRALGTRNYIPYVVEDDRGIVRETENFFVEFNGAVDITKDVFLERVFKYRAVEVAIDEPEIIALNVPPLIEVVMNMVPIAASTNLKDGDTLLELANSENKVTLIINE